MLFWLIFTCSSPPFETLVMHLSAVSRPLYTLYLWFFAVILEFEQKMICPVTEALIVRRSLAAFPRNSGQKK